MDHEGRLVCAACLAKQPKSEANRGSRWINQSTAAVAGFLVSWLFFYALGSVLVNLPSPMDIWSGK